MKMQTKVGMTFMGLGVLIGLGAFMLQPNQAASPVPIDQLGLAANHAQVADVVAQTTPSFMIVGADEQHNIEKRVCLWDAVLKVYGKHTPNYPQKIGDCTSFGAKNVGEHLQCFQIVSGSDEEFKLLFPPYQYGYSRVIIGKNQIRGDGSVGAWTAQAAQDGGFLAADEPQCPKYDGQVAKEWGAKGPPAWAKEAASPFKVKTISRLSTAQEGCDSICNGYPFTIASNYGTSKIVEKDGRRVAVWNSSWPHQMAVVGYDGTSPSGDRYFYVLNSWGPNAHPQPLNGEPPGGFWVPWKDMDRIIKQGDSWAYSSFDGFPPSELDFSIFKAVANVGAGRDTFWRSDMFQFMDGGTILCAVALGCMLAGALLVWFSVGKKRGTAGLAALVVVSWTFILSANAEDAIDFKVVDAPSPAENSTDSTLAALNNKLDFSVITAPPVMMSQASEDAGLDFTAVSKPVAKASEAPCNCDLGEKCVCSADGCNCKQKANAKLDALTMLIKSNIEMREKHERAQEETAARWKAFSSEHAEMQKAIERLTDELIELKAAKAPVPKKTEASTSKVDTQLLTSESQLKSLAKQSQTAKAPPPVVQYQQNCPNGNCMVPAYQRRGVTYYYYVH